MVNSGLRSHGSRLGTTVAEVDRWFDRVFGVQPAAVAGWSLPVWCGKRTITPTSNWSCPASPRKTWRSPSSRAS